MTVQYSTQFPLCTFIRFIRLVKTPTFILLYTQTSRGHVILFLFLTGVRALIPFHEYNDNANTKVNTITNFTKAVRQH